MNQNKLTTSENLSKFLLYTTPKGDVKVEIYFKDENIWLSQKMMADLFGCSTDNISLHLRNIFKDEELVENSVVEEFSITARDGKNYRTKHYNLDAIISVGYRVNSTQATKFRIWATARLKEFMIKGFILDDERLKNGKYFGKDYFDELLERIREIRTSERRAYQKLADIFEQCSADYNPKANETKLFYAMVQNKLHYAITGKTAAEIIHSRADHKKDFMGLTNWKNSPDGKILKSDTKIAKNYLSENEVIDLNLLVSAYLDLAEFQARRHTLMKMNDWIERTNKYLDSNSLDVLSDVGKISHDKAVKKAGSEFDAFRVDQDKKYISELDRHLEKLKGK